MRRTFFSALALVAALLLVATAPGPASPAGTADAQTQTTTPCTVSSFIGSEDLICEGSVADADDTSDAISLYQAALQTDTGNNQWFNLFDNYLSQTQDWAWGTVQVETAQAASNGSTATAAEVDATERLNGYYSTHDQNLLDKWNLMVTGFETYQNQASNIGYDMWEGRFYEDITESCGTFDTCDVNYGNFSVMEKNRTLADGTDFEVKALRVDVTAESDDGEGNIEEDTKTLTVDPFNAEGSVELSPSTYSVSVHLNYLRLNPPTEDYEARNYLSLSRAGDRHSEIDSQLSDMKNNTGTFVDGVYSSLESGEIDPNDVIDYRTQMSRFTQDAATENATFSESVVGLAAAGFDTPNMTNTAYMNLSYQRDANPTTTVENQGMLLSSSSPEKWEIGKTYDSANWSGPQMVVTLDGDQHVINGTFTIDAAHRNDGTEIDDPQISSRERSFETTNTTETQELLVQLSEDINRFENISSSNGGAGGSNGGLNFGFDLGSWFDGLGETGPMMAVILGIALLLMLLVVVS